MTAIAGLLAIAIALTQATRAQRVLQEKTGEALPSFEVASIRQDTSSGLNSSFSWRYGGDAFKARNCSLQSLIAYAWDTRLKSQIESGAGKLMAERFDIDARVSQDDVGLMRKMSHAQVYRQICLMLQQLLIDRFGLKVHIEVHDLPVLSLVVAKGGLKFHATADSASLIINSSVASAITKPRHDGISITNDSQHAEMTATRQTMDALANILSDRAEAEGQFVVNKTGLTGVYDFSLQWTPEYLTSGTSDSTNAATPNGGPSGPSLFSAIRDQLGLKLEPGKAPVEIVIIDRVEPPSPN